MKKLIQLSATPALVAGMAALSPAAEAQSFFDEVNVYVGATGGYLSGEANHDEDGGDNEYTEADLGVLSVLAGIDTRSDGWLLGIEGDIGLVLGDYPRDDDTTIVKQWSDMNYNAHLRARVGRAFGNADVFIAAGLALAEFETEDFGGNTDTHTLTGFSIGAGVDWAFSDRMKARVEILHDDYGREDTIRDGDNQYSGDWSDVTVRGGLLFQF